ncbi:MAG TPA: hypothetical protein VGY13_10855 [Solirubrobacteraceae bacterium]|jgi:hypothetical protein|nr:hypothetical protein [Solirubrobacteraceae bacterium]
MYEHGSSPRARQDGLLEETVGEELLLYDQESHTAHCLSPIAACVWRHCDGERDLAALARLAGVSESLVASALYELREKDLLNAQPEFMPGAIPGVSRREAIGRAARYGAAAAATGSLIMSATAATPAMASSGEEEKGLRRCSKEGTTGCCTCRNGTCSSLLSVNPKFTKEGCANFCGGEKEIVDYLEKWEC